MVEHLDTLSALRRIAEGRIVPAAKYAALQRASLIRVRGHGPRSKPGLTEAGQAALAAAPPPPGGLPFTAPEEVLMPHHREHPLAGRVVIPDSSLTSGEPVEVVDWMDREPQLALEAGHRISGWYRPDANSVLIRDRMGFALLPAEDLPAYDPQPAGYVS